MIVSICICNKYKYEYDTWNCVFIFMCTCIYVYIIRYIKPRLQKNVSPVATELLYVEDCELHWHKIFKLCRVQVIV